MMHKALLATLLCTISLCAQPPSPAPQNPATQPCSDFLCDVRVDWIRNNGMVYLAADAMPEDKYNSKPTPEQQTFGERVLHVADVDVQVLAMLGAKTPAPKLNLKATSKKEIIAALRTASEYGDAVLKEFDEASLKQRIPIESPFLGPTSSRLRLAYFAMTHAQDTYGQLCVYLRLVGVIPPLSRLP